MSRYFTPARRDRKGIVAADAAWHWDAVCEDLEAMLEACGPLGLAQENFALSSALHAAYAIARLKRDRA